jgi:NAD+ synthase (glutamine-hydrolysing)
MNYGFIKVASAVPQVRVADCSFNILQLESLIAQAEGQGVEVVVFPELSITGYTCQDLFRQQLLLDKAESGVMQLLDFTRKLNIIAIVGAPVPVGDLLLNCAIVIQCGQILGIVPKTYLPNYGEFYEKRWFASSQDLRPTTIHYAGRSVLVTADAQVFRTCNGVRFGIEICEDVWAPTPPSNHLSLAGADLIFNLSASDEVLGKNAYLEDLLAQQSARTLSGYIYASAGFGESTQDVVYGGKALIFENGRLLARGQRFSLNAQLVTSQIDVELLRSERRDNTTFVNAQRVMAHHDIHTVDALAVRQYDFQLERNVDPHPFLPSNNKEDESLEEIFSIQVMGLAKRVVHTHARTVVVGISGGLDSTLALLVCVKTFDKLKMDRKGVIGVTMPGFGTTDRTYHNALHLMQSLSITIREIPIGKSVTQHFSDIGHDPEVRDVTYENSQARERTQILMDLSNQLGGMVIGTGDLSELALGWATYNGDQMSMYGVNASIPKTLIKHLVRYVARTSLTQETAAILYDIIDTPISPELIPANENGQIKQKTEDLVGPYELHDFFLYHFLRHGFSPSKIFMLAQKAFQQRPTSDTDKDYPTQNYSDEVILHWLGTFCRRFFNQQFKRSCMPDGPKVGSVNLSPRGDWRMPSDAVSALWLQEVKDLEEAHQTATKAAEE